MLCPFFKCLNKRDKWLLKLDNDYDAANKDKI